MNYKKTSQVKLNIERYLEAGFLENKKIVLFGLNVPTSEAIAFLKEKNIEIYAVVDNYKYKTFDEINEIEIKNPDEILSKKNKKFVFLIGSQYFKEIKKQILSYGYSNESILNTLIKAEASLDENSFSNEINKARRGFDLYKGIKKNINNGLIIALPYDAIGDTYLITSYLKTFIKTKNIDNYCILVVGNSSEKILRMFEVSSYKVINFDEMNDFINYVSMIGFNSAGVLVLNHIKPHTQIYSQIEKFCSLEWIRIIKNIKLGLKNEVKPEQPLCFCDIEIKEHKESKKIIISPYANTLTEMNKKNWEKIVENLVKNGFEVFTNSIDEVNEPIIKGTKKISFELSRAYEILQDCSCFISIRNGLCDVLINSKTRKIIVYPTKESLFFTIKEFSEYPERVEEICFELQGEQIIEKITELAIKKTI